MRDPSLLGVIGRENRRARSTLRQGSPKFLITGTLEKVPGDVGISAAIGPRVYIPERYVAQTGLVVFGSRAEYERLFKLPASASPASFIQRYRQRFAQGVNGSMRSAGSNESRLASAIDQLHDYLAIVGLVALLLGGIGVASGVNAFAMSKIDAVAILRCVGATSWQVLIIYTSQAAVMGFLGAAAGVVLGVGIQFLMPLALKDFLPVDVDVHLAPASLFLGLGIGVWVALLFSLQVARRATSRVAAASAQTTAGRRSASAFTLRPIPSRGLVGDRGACLGVGNGSLEHRRGADLGSRSVTIAAAIGTLWVSAAFLSWVARRALRPSWPFPLRQGIASLYRPGNQTRAVVLALGFGGVSHGGHPVSDPAQHPAVAQFSVG